MIGLEVGCTVVATFTDEADAWRVADALRARGVLGVGVVDHTSDIREKIGAAREAIEPFDPAVELADARSAITNATDQLAEALAARPCRACLGPDPAAGVDCPACEGLGTIQPDAAAPLATFRAALEKALDALTSAHDRAYDLTAEALDAVDGCAQ